MVGGRWLVVGCRWLVVGGRWQVAGGRWLMVVSGCGGGGQTHRDYVDEQSGALHMFTSCLANFALPTSPRSSLGAQSSCSRILRLSTVPPIDPAVSPTPTPPTQCPTS